MIHNIPFKVINTAIWTAKIATPKNNVCGYFYVIICSDIKI